MSFTLSLLAWSTTLVGAYVLVQSIAYQFDVGVTHGAGPRDTDRPPGKVAGRARRALANLGETYAVFVALSLVVEPVGARGTAQFVGGTAILLGPLGLFAKLSDRSALCAQRLLVGIGAGIGADVFLGGALVAIPWLEFAGLMLAFGVSAVVPGADFAMVLRQSISRGRRPALFTAAGIASAILVHGSYTLLGVGVIVAQSLIVFNILKWLGAAYLIWLAIAALRAPPPQPLDDLDSGARARGDGAAFVLGFLTNLLNPKAVLFFLALFTTLVSAHTSMQIKALYVGSMSITLFSWFALVAVFFTTPAVRLGFFRLGRWFNRVSGITFIVLAVRVAVAQQH
ncbi:LysE family transporter [Devosia algicola]|uniref:LysE family transporter n=2 Tax=Devosia algicola TaxID=3026418 RepID=A0ABY7YKC1_9HYPH|nr:LysE family transporter [Devosia algicola]WDR01654.1 LysE family transporter [Devosia algicola]